MRAPAGAAAILVLAWRLRNGRGPFHLGGGRLRRPRAVAAGGVPLGLGLRLRRGSFARRARSTRPCALRTRPRPSSTPLSRREACQSTQIVRGGLPLRRSARSPQPELPLRPARPPCACRAPRRPPPWRRVRGQPAPGVCEPLCRRLDLLGAGGRPDPMRDRGEPLLALLQALEFCSCGHERAPGLVRRLGGAPRLVGGLRSRRSSAARAVAAASSEAAASIRAASSASSAASTRPSWASRWVFSSSICLRTALARSPRASSSCSEARGLKELTKNLLPLVRARRRAARGTSPEAARPPGGTARRRNRAAPLMRAFASVIFVVRSLPSCSSLQPVRSQSVASAGFDTLAPLAPTSILGRTAPHPEAPGPQREVEGDLRGQIAGSRLAAHLVGLSARPRSSRRRARRPWRPGWWSCRRPYRRG